MKKIVFVNLILTFIFFTGNSVFAQKYTYKGKVTDANTGESLIGVNITIKDNVHGTVSGYDGTFEYSCSFAPPLVFHVSYVGYEKKNITVNNTDEFINVELEELNILGQEVVVSASRVEESIREAPVSIEKMNLRDIQQVSAANFYDGLYQLKGVDMNVHGLMFRTPNTRGFNSYTNYRMNQIIDGVENISPGMSFAPGNITGLSQSDIESVEMIIGASSALYGPGGMNGTLLMKSKDPFKYQGLTISAQTGLMHVGSDVLDAPKPMGDISLRYAKAFSNRMAVKITGSFLRATDWFANDMRNRANLNDPTLNRETDPGYDGVNVYGDETLVSFNMLDIKDRVLGGIVDVRAEQLGYSPGSPKYDQLQSDIYSVYGSYFPNQTVTRTGWNEYDLSDNITENFKIGGAFHYFITERTEFIAKAAFVGGSNVYTAVNRFALNDYRRVLGKLEINNPNYFFRVWGNGGSSGNSYDLGATALLMNEAWKPSQDWFTDYVTSYTYAMLQNVDASYAHTGARMAADNRKLNGDPLYSGKPAFPFAGSEEFNTIKNNITSKILGQGGSQVVDKTKVMQAEGMYNFSNMIDFMNLQVGANYRLYSVNSNGSIFFDEPGNPLSIYQFGGYVQVIKDFANDHLRGTGTFRYDKNQNFKAQYTPRFSLIYFVDNERNHSIRGTFQTAYRFPSLSDQLLDIQAGLYRNIGGLDMVREKYNFSSTYLFPMSGRNPIKDRPILENGSIKIPALGPEKVVSTEMGYKGLLLNKKLFLDCYVYYNKYKGFEATQLIAQYEMPNPEPQDKYTLYETYFTTEDPVTSMGWALSVDYLFPNGILLKGNVAYNKLLDGIDQPGVEASYNTPDYRTNISIGHKRIIKNLGFNVNFHWQNSFLWEGSFGTGEIPAFATVDAHLAYKIPAAKTTIKIGGSNLTNNYYTTSFGSAQIGGLYYITLVYDDVLGYIERKRN